MSDEQKEFTVQDLKDALEHFDPKAKVKGDTCRMFQYLVGVSEDLFDKEEVVLEFK